MKTKEEIGILRGQIQILFDRLAELEDRLQTTMHTTDQRLDIVAQS